MTDETTPEGESFAVLCEIREGAKPLYLKGLSTGDFQKAREEAEKQIPPPPRWPG